MFTYATCHLISHATGLFLLDAIERIGHDIILVPWRTPLGLLLAAFLTHLGLGLRRFIGGDTCACRRSRRGSSASA